MSRNKYRMTDATAKRIAKRMLAVWEKHHRLSIADIEMLLREEDFWGAHKSSYVSDLVEWLIEEYNGTFANDIAQAYIRSHYDLREGIDSIHGGLQKVGIIPYPEDDDE